MLSHLSAKPSVPCGRGFFIPPESPFRTTGHTISHTGKALSEARKSPFRPADASFTFHSSMRPDAEEPVPHRSAMPEERSGFLFHDFPLSKIFTTELHKYAFRDLTERQRKDKHPYTISPRHPPISHLFITPPQRRQPVETQNLASHEKVSTNHTCNNQTVIIIFPTREAHSIASHTHDNQSPVSAILACETQNFASLLLAGSGINQIIYTAGKTGLRQENP